MPLRKFDPASAVGGHQWITDDFGGALYDCYMWGLVGGSGSIPVVASAVGGLIVVRADASNYYELAALYPQFTVARNFQITWRGKLESLTTSRAAWGLQTDVNNRVEWIYEAALGANWRCRSVASSTGTVVASAVAADTAFHEFTMVSATGLVHFALDGVPITTITTNLPTGALGPFIRSTSTAAGTRDVTTDWVEAFCDRTA